jgi:hypothetical protein
VLVFLHHEERSNQKHRMDDKAEEERATTYPLPISRYNVSLHGHPCRMLDSRRARCISQ